MFTLSYLFLFCRTTFCVCVCSGNKEGVFLLPLGLHGLHGLMVNDVLPIILLRRRRPVLLVTAVARPGGHLWVLSPRPVVWTVRAVRVASSGRRGNGDPGDLRPGREVVHERALLVVARGRAGPALVVVRVLLTAVLAGRGGGLLGAVTVQRRSPALLLWSKRGRWRHAERNERGEIRRGELRVRVVRRHVQGGDSTRVRKTAVPAVELDYVSFAVAPGRHREPHAHARHAVVQVGLEVLVEHGALGERLAAQVAAVGLRSEVNSEVLVQDGLLAKLLAALGAVVRLDAGVRAQMLIQNRLLSKAPLTKRARVRFLTCTQKFATVKSLVHSTLSLSYMDHGHEDEFQQFMQRSCCQWIDLDFFDLTIRCP